MTEVWLVLRDDTADNNVLGVFDSSADAEAFATDVGPEFPGAVLTIRFPIGWRFDAGAERYK